MADVHFATPGHRSVRTISHTIASASSSSLPAPDQAAVELSMALHPKHGSWLDCDPNSASYRPVLDRRFPIKNLVGNRPLGHDRNATTQANCLTIPMLVSIHYLYLQSD